MLCNAMTNHFHWKAHGTAILGISHTAFARKVTSNTDGNRWHDEK